jgi:nifR3 family TIM-barrel protein
MGAKLKTALKPVMIGPVRIDPPLFLAPMAGQTNHPFRRLVREMGGCGLVCTELISSLAIHYKSQRTFQMFDWNDFERPVAVQLFGGDPAVMAEAAQMVESRGADIVDINMGCWVPKVAKGGAGAVLLRDVCTAAKVVEACVNAVKIPVTVKIRTGWTPEEITAVPFARAAADCGVKAIAVHGRTASQGFTGLPDWSIIRQVKEAVGDRVPIIGNGDVTDTATLLQMLDETGCDGVMIGRAALGNPWIFSSIMQELTTGAAPPPPSPGERARAALRHARLAVEFLEQPHEQIVRELRGQLTKYHLGSPGAARIREGIQKACKLEDIERLLGPVAEKP